jgi:hypothetical protein
MNEFTSSRAIVKLRLYHAAEVKSRYFGHLQETRDVARETEFTGEGEEGADKDVEMAKEQETGEERRSVGKAKDSWGGKEVIYLD